MQPSTAPFHVLPNSLPSTAMVLKPALLLHPPGAKEFNLAALNNLPKNVVGLQSYSDFVKAACQPEVIGDVGNQPVHDRTKPVSIRGHSFRFVGVPISESECSYQSDITTSSGQAAEEFSRGDRTEEVSVPVPAWTPAASPAKSILRRSSVAPTQPPQTSPKQLVYDYASSASPASRRMSTVSYCASSKRTSAQRRRLSFDTGVQVQQPVEHTEAEYRQASYSARKLRSRRSSISSRRMSSASTCRPATYAGFEPFGLSDAGALLCETNGRKFLLVVDDVEPEEQVGTQCQPLDIDVEMDLLFERLDEAGDEQSDGVMEVEQMRSAAVLPDSHHVLHGELSSFKTAVEGTQEHDLPHSIPRISLSGLPATPRTSTTPIALHRDAETETHKTASQMQTEVGATPVEAITPHSMRTRSVSNQREGSVDMRGSKGTQSGGSPMCTPSENANGDGVESAELAADQSICSPQQPKVALNESFDKEKLIAARKEVHADAAIISGIDVEHEEEIVVATTMHTSRNRSPPAPLSLSGPVSASPSKTMGRERVQDASVDSNQISLPQGDNDLLVEILEDPEVPESGIFSSTPSQSCQAAQKTDASGVCDDIDTQIMGEEAGNSGSLLEKESDASVVDDETGEVANSVAANLPITTTTKSDSSAEKTVPSSIAGNAEFVTQATASVSVPPVSKKDEGCRNQKSIEVEARRPSNTRQTINGSGNRIHLQTNVSPIDIAPRVTAYQLAILQTLTPNTKATLAKIRGSKGPYAVQGVQVSPVDSTAPYRQRIRTASENVRNVSKHERGTSITRSARDHDSNRTEYKLQHEQSTRSAKPSGNDLIEKTRLGAENSERWIQVSGTHFSPETDKPGHCSGAGGNSLSTSEPRQPEMLLRVPTCPAPVTPIECMQPEIELRAADEVFEDVGQLQDVKLDSTSDFLGLMSPAPLSKRVIPGENEVINVDGEGSELSLQVVAVHKVESRSSVENVVTRSGSSKIPKSVEDVPSVGMGDRIQHQDTESQKDDAARDLHTTGVLSNDNEADPALCEQPSNFDDCEDYEDCEDHGDEGFGVDDDADVKQDSHLEGGDNEVSDVVPHSETKSERSKQMSSSSSRKQLAACDVLSSDTLDAPLKQSDSEEEGSPTLPSSSSPCLSEKPSSETSSPVIRRRSKRVTKGKKVSQKRETSKNKKKRQWRELAHLPVGEIRIDDGPGPRRSKRQRFPRLKYWKNEVVSYERRTSQIMPTVSEVLVDIGDTDSEEAWMPRR